MMRDVIDVKRYIDDGVGVHMMSERRFGGWKKLVSSKVYNFAKLEIKPCDWSTPTDKHKPVNFLDILFWFDEKKSLQTDLFKKPTDSRAYLNFSSCHPNYTFSGTVKSQATRLRRIINDATRLSDRLDEMEADFRRCGYPEKLIKNIFDQVKNTERVLVKNKSNDPEKDDTVMVISTHGTDQKLTEITKKIEKHSEELKFRYVKKTGPSLKNILIKS